MIDLRGGMKIASLQDPLYRHQGPIQMGRGKFFFLIGFLYSLGVLFLSFLGLGFIDFPICKVIFDWLKKEKKIERIINQNSSFHSEKENQSGTVQVQKIAIVHQSTVKC